MLAVAKLTKNILTVRGLSLFLTKLYDLEQTLTAGSNS